MRHSRLAAVLPVLLVASGIAVAPLAASAQRPREPMPVFRADVELVLLNIAVVDDDGEPLTGLSRDDFRIFEDGRRQDITLFATSADTPIDVAVVLDASGSVAATAPTVKEDAKAFLQSLGPRDCVYLLPFHDVVGGGVWAAPDNRSLSTMIDQIELKGGTALYDAVRRALVNVDRTKYGDLPGEIVADNDVYDGDFCGVALPPPSPSRPGSVRRTAVVVLSDGGDEHSLASYADTLISAWANPVPIVAVAIGEALPPRGGPMRGRWSPGSRAYRRMLAYSNALEHRLGQLAYITGGQLILANNRNTVSESFEDVVTTLRSSYLVGYHPPQDDGFSVLSWHDIDVEVSTPDADVRARPGYYRNLADTAGAARIVRDSPALIRQLRPEEALRQLELALRLDASYWPIYLQQAKALRALERDAEARQALETVLYLHPGLGAAHELLAEVAYLLGDTDLSWYHAIRAWQDEVDDRDLIRELIVQTGMPEGLEDELRAPRVFVDVAPTPEELDQSTLLELLRVVREEISRATDVGLISLANIANFGLYLEVEKIEGSPRKLEGKLLVSEVPYETIHDEDVKIDDVDDPEAVARGMARAVDKVREWMTKRHAGQQ